MPIFSDTGVPLPSSFTVLRAIVFDLDGTLINSYDAIAGSLNHAMATLGHPPIPEADVRRMVGYGLEDLLARALDIPVEHADRQARIVEGVRLFRERYDQVCEAETTLLPGVAVTLSQLGARGYRMAVATNKASYFARRLLSALGVGTYLSAVVGPDLVTHKKPHPEMIETALAAMGARREETVYVGDMEVDVQTARAAGLPVIVLPTGSCSAVDLERTGADLLLPSFADLLDLLPGPSPESPSP
jgi:phosphoglycolate phosphatase